MYSQESGPRGSKPDPPSFFPWRLQWGLSVFQWGFNPHNPPPIFTLPIDTKRMKGWVGLECRLGVSHSSQLYPGGQSHYAFRQSDFELPNDNDHYSTASKNHSISQMCILKKFRKWPTVNDCRWAIIRLTHVQLFTFITFIMAYDEHWTAMT